MIVLVLEWLSVSNLANCVGLRRKDDVASAYDSHVRDIPEN